MIPTQTEELDSRTEGYRNSLAVLIKTIDEQRGEIMRLKSALLHMNTCRHIAKCPPDETLAEWLKGVVRLDDPVVTGLVEALKSANKWVRRIDDRQDDLPGSFIPFGTDPSGSVRGTRAAISAYEARVKEAGK